MPLRRKVQTFFLNVTLICGIVLSIIVISLAITSLCFTMKFDMISPERTSWKIIINIMFCILAVAIACVYINGKDDDGSDEVIMKQRSFAMAISIFDFICFLGCLTGTILLIDTIIKYPGKWESVESSEKRIEYEMKSNCCLIYKKEEPLIFKDCPLVNTTNENVTFTNCKDKYNFILCDKEDLNISESQICSKIPKEDYPFQICSIVIGSVLTFVYFSLSTIFFITFFLKHCESPQKNVELT